MLNESQTLPAGARQTLTDSVLSPVVKTEEQPLDFQLLFESVPTPILVLAPNPPYFSILAVNNFYIQATGKQRQDLVSHNLFDVFPDNPDDPTATGVSELRLSLNRALQAKAPDRMGVQKYDIPVTDPASPGFEVRYWSPINTPVIGPDGQVCCILHRVEDVTEFIQQKAQAVDEAEKASLLKEKSEQMEAEVLRQALQIKADNRQFKEKNVALELREQELSQINQRLQELDRVKTTFFNNVSHEFRTPLTLMLGPLEEALHSEETNAATKSSLDIAYRNALRLYKLVNNLLDFARIEAGKVQATYQPTELAQFTRELASMFSSVTDKANLKLVIDCPHLSEPVYVDRDMWEKIVLNLLSNAFKHTLAGKIMVRMRCLGNHVTLTVADTGVGIPDDQLSRLFERFHRVPNAKSRTQEGSGIGLALVNELVKLHGGSIKVSSQLGKGSTFTVSIPLGRAHIPQDQLLDDSAPTRLPLKTQPYVAEALRWLPPDIESDSVLHQHRASEMKPELWRKPDGGLVRVLIADDNADMRDYVFKLLFPHCDVEVAGDGEAALKAIRRHVPDLVLTDIMMPRMDGMALLGELKKDPQLKTVPVILLSARAGEEAKVEGLQAGADDYLVKPFNNRELLARARANLNLELLHAKDQAEEAQAESEERFKILFNQAASGMAQADLNGKFMLVNRRYCEMLGRSQEELLHLHMHELTVSEDLQDNLAMLEQLKRTGEPFVIEKRYIRSDGALIWVRNFVSLVRGRQGQPLSFLAVSQDITEQKESELAIRKAQSDLKKYAAKLERSNRDLEHFAVIASHDLQEPLRKVMMFSDHLQMITASYLTPEAKDDIQRLQRATQKMQTLIDNLLDLSRITRHGHEFQRVDLSDTMREVQADLHNLLKETHGRIEVDQMIEFEGDPSQIQQLMTILVNNALKFHREDVPPLVKVSSKFLDADYCQILVADNGIGIKPEYQTKIFDAFVRLNSHHAYPGNGIGLTIAQKIVDRHDGTIQVCSNLEQGSIFMVKLPIYQQTQ